MDCCFEISAIEDPTLLLPHSELCLAYGPDYWIEDYNYAELPLLTRPNCDDYYKIRTQSASLKAATKSKAGKKLFSDG